MGGGGMYNRQTGGEAYAVFSQQLERNHSLIVVHGQNGVEPAVSTRSEETVCRKRTKRVNSVVSFESQVGSGTCFMVTLESKKGVL